ncbi:adhesive plaque matrix protein [Cephus cinctus]|uniref:Adhesive plaque matrix protein n=1 Tax=Cephus cinctus TaxID=211228 RepID=A0AAJ7BPF2_CEPCN|nr:adhesive plaque matrix protein [Cephus cinctus]
MRIILLVIPACLLVLAEARRVQVRPRVTEPQVYYEDEDNQAAEDDYSAPVAYQPRTRALPSPRSKNTIQSSKAPPVQTIRNYNKVNDDGSFTFGYEAADGSFKEETRGTDCVVRGKYGYVDPDGNKREFTYVSGNPCDPNAPKEEDDDPPQKQEQDEVSGPANYPSVRPVPRPIRPNYPQTTTRAPTTIFQTQYELDDDQSQELEEAKPTPSSASFRRPQQPIYVQVTGSPSSALYQPAPTSTPLYRPSTTATPQYQPPTTPATAYRTRQPTPATYQPRDSSTRAPAQQRPQSVAITPRPHAAQIAAQYASPSNTERPGVIFATRPSASTSARTTTPSTPHLDFAAELERYVNTVGVTSRPSPNSVPSKLKASPSADPIYQSELVFDRATGQYNTQLYQTLPQTVGDFSLSHKLQPYVAQPQSLLSLQQLQQQQSQHYRQPASAQSAPSAAVASQPQEAIYRQQQADLLQQSQHLFAQQQRRQQQPQRFQLLESQRDAQPFYYVSPSQSTAGEAAPLSVGQIDQFLRGHAGNF